MILPLIDKKIRQAFSDSAMQYEVLASLQKEIGRELVAKIINRENCSHILDVGMGPGWLTHRLNNLFPESYVVGLDFAKGMVECAKSKYEDLDIVQADARILPFKENTFDVIISNLAYQWVKDLEAAFQCCHSLLKEGGVFCFTMFGRDTLKELFFSMEKSFLEHSKAEELLDYRLVDKQEVMNLLKKAGYKEIRINCEYIKSHFSDMFALMKWLKDTGANINKNNVYIGKEFLLRTNEFYQKNYQDRFGIYATFEVIWVETLK